MSDDKKVDESAEIDRMFDHLVEADDLAKAAVIELLILTTDEIDKGVSASSCLAESLRLIARQYRLALEKEREVK